MTHEQICDALRGLYPTAEWSYDGDGSTLDPVHGQDGQLVSVGLEWHGDQPRPSLTELAAWAPPPPRPAPDPLADAFGAGVQALADALAPNAAPTTRAAAASASREAFAACRRAQEVDATAAVSDTASVEPTP